MMAVLGYVAGVVSDTMIKNGISVTYTRKIMQVIRYHYVRALVIIFENNSIHFRK
jgi:hypothetical protein